MTNNRDRETAVTLDTVYSDGQQFTTTHSAAQAPIVARALTNAIHDHVALALNGARLVSFAFHSGAR